MKNGKQYSKTRSHVCSIYYIRIAPRQHYFSRFTSIAPNLCQANVRNISGISAKPIFQAFFERLSGPESVGISISGLSLRDDSIMPGAIEWIQVPTIRETIKNSFFRKYSDLAYARQQSYKAGAVHWMGYREFDRALNSGYGDWPHTVICPRPDLAVSELCKGHEHASARKSSSISAALVQVKRNVLKLWITAGATEGKVSSLTLSPKNELNWKRP